MDLGDGSCALANRASNALNRSRPHVAYGEYARNARFKCGWRAAIRTLRDQPGEDESMCVERDLASAEPTGFRIRPDEDEHVAYVGFLLGAGIFVAPRNRLQPGSLITVEPRELAVGMKLDDRRRRNAIDQIARHRRRETFTAYQHVHPGRVIGEEHRGLSGRIAAADDCDFLARAQLGFQRRGPVPDTPAFEVRQAGHRRTAITRAARDHDGARPQGPAIRELQRQLALAPRFRAIERRCLPGYQHFRAELLRLHEGATSQRLTRDAGRKTQIVLDTRTRTRLTAERPAVDDDHSQSFRRGVHG